MTFCFRRNVPCDAPGTTRIDLEKHCRFSVHTGDGPADEHQTARLNVFFCAACADLHGSELQRAGRASGTVTPRISRAIEYLVNPPTDSMLGSADPAWHGFRFRSAAYAAKFRELNARLIWTPTNYARESAKRRRFYYLQLIILISFATALAL